MDPKVFKIVAILGTVTIIVVYIVIIYLKYRSIKSLEDGTNFPPWPSQCPDYWAVEGKDKCKNIHKIGDCKSGEVDNIMDFSEPIFKGKKGMYYKCNWARKCNTPWEGIDTIC
jgi:hypothetical protein